jgi:hypothetical protein
MGVSCAEGRVSVGRELVAVLVVLALTAPAVAQTTVDDAGSTLAQSKPKSEPLSLGRFRVLLHSGDRHEGAAGVLDGDALRGRDERGNQVSFPRSDIRALDTASGSRSAEYAAIGGGICLLSGLAAWATSGAQTAADPTRKTVSSGQALAIIGGFTAAGTIIGAVIGSGKKSWKRVLPAQTTVLLVPSVGPRHAGAVLVVTRGGGSGSE